ncbi:helix-turn-helix transcriptional regulator [Pseudomonas citronellolis]|uniref:helix-turn-helix domain-containing protein n=1 Tax=Pseudomonas citronellolis TaxID=53408 RepID=UPI00248D7FCF|nr:helix-turn-helix transcriptional regulator [Pseudomonas citronellolis]
MATEFKDRFVLACDRASHVPPKFAGRGVDIAKAVDVSQEAVRRWFEGSAMPRPKTMKKLAAYLGCDDAWLALGVEPPVATVEEKISRVINESGAIQLVAGLIMLDGHECAFPAAGIKQANGVDLYAISRGTQFALNVALARAVEPGKYEVTIPTGYIGVKCVAVFYRALDDNDVVVLPHDVIGKHKRPAASGLVLDVEYADGEYLVAQQPLPVFRAFGAFYD